MHAQQQPLEGRPGAPGGHSKGVGSGTGGGFSQVVALLLFLGASALVAALGGLATANHVNGWYATADKAPWSPPNWVFGPVWTVLYAAMAVAAWLVWRSRAPGSKAALTAEAHAAQNDKFQKLLKRIIDLFFSDWTVEWIGIEG